MQPTAAPRMSHAVARLCAAVGHELLPVLLWVSMFGVTRVAPSLVLRLSMALPQVMDVPRLLLWRRPRGDASSTGGGIVAAADAASARLAELISSIPPGSSGGGVGGGDAVLPASWQRLYHRSLEALVSLITYPSRLWSFVIFQDRQHASTAAASAAAAAAAVGVPWRSVVVRHLLRVLTSFTSTWVHASGTMLFDTLVTYLRTHISLWGAGGLVVGDGRLRRGRSGGWRDLLVAACVSTGVNYLVQTCWVAALTSTGELRALPVTRAVGDAAPSSSTPVSDRAQFLLSTLARLGSKDSLYRLGRLVMEADYGFGAVERERPDSTSSSSPPSRPPTASPAPSPPPARVYVCGGSSFVFALSGLRYVCYRDAQQLTTAASSCIADALDLVLRQVRRRSAARRGRVAEAFLQDGPVWRPPGPSTDDVVLTPAASLQLLPVYMANFFIGAGVGLVWRERRHLLAVARRVPVLSEVAQLLFPLPPPPLRLPEALQELSTEYHVLLLHPDGSVEVAAEEPPVTSLPGVSIVAAQELFCPIKRALMCDPVQTVDGFTYDRDVIEEWLRAHDTAPLTNLPLESTTLRVNWQARQQLYDLVLLYTRSSSSGDGHDVGLEGGGTGGGGGGVTRRCAARLA
ncbi:U-box domain containing protein [Novymonas esmeraldas]|uniref:U-box domain containing protein n=1 Tax=Novymonas esmeraldas TaxID=1808958 RepID=A0AAW0F6P1_9TRYP